MRVQDPGGLRDVNLIRRDMNITALPVRSVFKYALVDVLYTEVSIPSFVSNPAFVANKVWTEFQNSPSLLHTERRALSERLAVPILIPSLSCLFSPPQMG